MMEGDIVEQGNLAVCINNLNKSYNNGPPILNHFCMNVKKGEVYALLGSSGCGKTTVLSCIVGLEKWDSGNVLVFGNDLGSGDCLLPGNILGYMPQELSLYPQLTTLENIQFYGRMYNMKSREITRRWEFLKELLDLQIRFKLINELSGGEQRRVSLAVALVHSPRLLILDEPTVGLDPLLRQRIWVHLNDMVTTMATTIILTTHYVEEAKNANTVGVLRHCRLLIENEPAKIINDYNDYPLEYIILQLCRQDGNTATIYVTNGDEKNVVTDVNLKSVGNQRAITTEHITTRLYATLQRVYGLSIVNLLTLIRYPVFLMVLLIMPAIQGSLTIQALGSKPKYLGFGIVNYEFSNWTNQCNFDSHNSSSCNLSALSCRYINQLKTDDLVVLVEKCTNKCALKTFYKTEEAASNQVRLGNIWGYLTFSHNYSQSILDRAIAKQFALNDSITGSQIHVKLDYSQSAASFFLIKHILYSHEEYMKQLANSCSVGYKQLEIPLSFRNPVYGNFEISFTPYVIPGVILGSIYAIVATLTALTLITDRRRGTWRRAVAAKLTITEVITSNLISQGIITIGQVFILNAVIYIAFDFRYVNVQSQCLVLVYCFLGGLAAVGIGLVVGIICECEVEALLVVFFQLPILLFFGGIIFPAENIPKFWRYLGYLLPTSMPTHSLRSIAIRGVGITHATVWPGFLVLITWIVLIPFYVVLAHRVCYA